MVGQLANCPQCKEPLAGRITVRRYTGEIMHEDCWRKVLAAEEKELEDLVERDHD